MNLKQFRQTGRTTRMLMSVADTKDDVVVVGVDIADALRMAERFNELFPDIQRRTQLKFKLSNGAVVLFMSSRHNSYHKHGMVIEGVRSVVDPAVIEERYRHILEAYHKYDKEQE